MRIVPPFWFILCAGCWTFFLAYWFYAAVTKRKAEKRRETGMQRMGQVLPMAAAYILMFTAVAHYGWIGTRFIPKLRVVEIAGFGLTAIGIAMAIWARRHLGANWSAQVTIRSKHELIRSGPYHRIRHPIYTGMLTAFFGTALALGEVRGILAFLIAATSFYFKARREESFLTQEFGSRFQEHTRDTGMFLPRLP